MLEAALNLARKALLLMTAMQGRAHADPPVTYREVEALGGCALLIAVAQIVTIGDGLIEARGTRSISLCW